jgi:hypothetical protein
MGRKGRPTRYTLTYEQKVWDNYNPYHPMKEPTAKELTEHYNEKHLLKMNKALTYMANSAGYEADKAIITIISKRLLGLLYN